MLQHSYFIVVVVIIFVLVILRYALYDHTHTDLTPWCLKNPRFAAAQPGTF